MKNKSFKDFDPDKLTAIIMCVMALSFGGFFGFYYGIRYWENGISGMIVGFLIGGFAFIVGRTIMNLTAKVFLPLAGKRSAHWTDREQLEGAMNEVRFHKRKEEYQKALKIINPIIEADPDFPDALYLKAQILWEGFRNHGGAKRHLQKIIDTADIKQDTIYRWAVSLSKDIDEATGKNESHE